MIEFNYTSAVNQANELQQISEELQELINSLKVRQGELNGAWKGESANIFAQKIEELCKDISKTAGTASGIASAVRTAASAVKAAEDAAKQIVQTVTR